MMQYLNLKTRTGKALHETANPFAFLDCLRAACPAARFSVQKHGAALSGAGASRLRVTAHWAPATGTRPHLPPFRKGTWRRPTWDRRLPAESFLPLPDTEEPPRWPLPIRARRGGPLAAQRGMRPPRGRGWTGPSRRASSLPPPPPDPQPSDSREDAHSGAGEGSGCAGWQPCGALTPGTRPRLQTLLRRFPSTGAQWCRVEARKR